MVDSVESKDYTVEEATMEDNSVVYLTEKDLEERSLFKGESILIRGSRGHDTLAIALTQDMAVSAIRMNKTMRKNVGVEIGDTIKIAPCTDAPYLNKVHILPFEDTIKKEKEYDLFNDYLLPYLKDQYRPLTEDDVFDYNSVEFKVIEVEPGKYGIVGPETVVFCDGEPIFRKEE